jgi:sugar lactone lactonase YvrE
MTRTWTALREGGNYFECPRWHDGRWWAVDFYRHGVFAYASDGTEELVLEVEGQPSGLGWLPEGDLLVVSMKDHRVLRRGLDGAVSVHADVGELVTGHLNDMVVDRAGGAYAGNFGFDLMAGERPASTVLVRIARDGTASVAAEDLWFPNGMVITDDDRLIVAETFGGRLTAFDIGENGALTGRRTFSEPRPVPKPSDLGSMVAGLQFAPDGIALDAEGHVWAANGVGAAVWRISPAGDVVEEVAMPEGLGVFACGLGGENGRTLLACAAPDFSEEARSAAAEAQLLTTPVEVPHAGLP